MLILNFKKIARTRGSHIRSQGHRRGRGRGRGQGRGRECGIQDDRAKIVELDNISTRGRVFPQASPSSSASIGNERNGIRNAQIDSQQDSSILAASISIYENVLKRA